MNKKHAAELAQEFADFFGVAQYVFMDNYGRMRISDTKPPKHIHFVVKVEPKSVSRRITSSNPPKALSLSTVNRYVPEMRRRGVSVVARSPRGFLPAFRRAGGAISRLSPYWRRRRENFVKRHMAQVKRRREPLYRDGRPTRRHLALIAWAYSPSI